MRIWAAAAAVAVVFSGGLVAWAAGIPISGAPPIYSQAGPTATPTCEFKIIRTYTPNTGGTPTQTPFATPYAACDDDVDNLGVRADTRNHSDNQVTLWQADLNNDGKVNSTDQLVIGHLVTFCSSTGLTFCAGTATYTPTPNATSTPTSTNTYTPTNTPTQTNTATATATNTAIPDGCYHVSGGALATCTATPSPTPTAVGDRAFTADLNRWVAKYYAYFAPFDVYTAQLVVLTPDNCYVVPTAALDAVRTCTATATATSTRTATVTPTATATGVRKVTEFQAQQLIEGQETLVLLLTIGVPCLVALVLGTAFLFFRRGR